MVIIEAGTTVLRDWLCDVGSRWLKDLERCKEAWEKIYFSGSQYFHNQILLVLNFSFPSQIQ